MMLHALRRIERTRFRSVLDIGCGDGTVLRRFVPYIGARTAVGIDLDAPDGDEAVILRRANLFDFLPDQRFELVISNQVFEHIYEPLLPRYIDVLKASSAPGGVILLSTPNRWRARNLARLLILRRPHIMQTNPGIRQEEHRGHHRECSYRELQQLLQASFDSRSWRLRIVRSIPPNQGSRLRWLARLAIYGALWPLWRPVFVSASQDHYVLLEHLDGSWVPEGPILGSAGTAAAAGMAPSAVELRVGRE
jgi:SAM-dependent methyltransferase